MRRIVPLLCVAAMYAAYLFTLPAPVTAVTGAQAAPRIQRELTLPALRTYAVSLGAFTDAVSARVAASASARRGAAACLKKTDGCFLLLCEACDTQGEADSVCRQLSSEGLRAETRLFSAEALTLLVRAEDAQIAALEDAVAALRDIPEALRSLASALDQNRADVPAAVSLASAQLTAAKDARAALQRSLGSAQDEFALGALTLLGDLCADLESALGETRPLSLSSNLRQCALQTRLGLTDLMNLVR